jgi:hypothetical protein
MSWLSKTFRKINKEIFDEALGLEDKTLRAVVSGGATALFPEKKDSKPAAPAPPLPGATASEVLAADLRLRRLYAGKNRGRSTMVTGGLAGTPARLTLPTLVGT